MCLNALPKAKPGRPRGNFEKTGAFWSCMTSSPPLRVLGGWEESSLACQSELVRKPESAASLAPHILEVKLSKRNSFLEILTLYPSKYTDLMKTAAFYVHHTILYSIFYNFIFDGIGSCTYYERTLPLSQTSDSQFLFY